MTIHPGNILLEEFLKPMGISQNALAKSVGVSARTINEIVLGRRTITPEMSIRLGKFFGLSPKYWHNMQNLHEWRMLHKKITKIEKGVKAHYQDFCDSDKIAV